MAAASLWLGLAARRIHVPVGADRADVLQLDATRVFAGAGGAEGVLRDE